MYAQKRMSINVEKTNIFVGILKVSDKKSRIRSRTRIRIRTHADPLVYDTDQRIRIRTKMSRIRNTFKE
jgi:hypothetical protein